MRATRIIADLPVADVESAKSFYTGYLGLRTEEFNMGWVARYTSPDTGANVQLVTRDAAAPENPLISVFTDDVDDRGLIGLQVHGIKKGAGPYQVRWRNIRINELERGEQVSLKD